MSIWQRPTVAFWGAFCATMGINALSNATSLLAGYYQVSLAEISPATSLYLIAEIAALPLIPLLTSRMGVPRLLRMALWGFLAGCLLCLIAPTLTALLFGRVVQGFFGGMLSTMPLLIMKSDLPEDKQPLAMAAAGFVSGFAPVVGPLLTAALTVQTIPWLFAIMAAVIAGCLLGLPAASTERGDVTTDTLPAGSMTALLCFTGGLISVVWAVEHLPAWGGWSSPSYRLHLGFGMVAILAAAIHQWKRDDALLPIAVLSKPRYLGVLMSSMMMGVVLFGLLYLIPYYLIRVHEAGVDTLFRVTLYATIPQLIWLPVVLFLRTRLSPYLLLTIGGVIGTLSVWQLTSIGDDFGGNAWLIPQALRAISIPMIVLPLSFLVIRLPSHNDSPALTSAFTLCRTAGGVIGVSGLTVYIESQQQTHLQSIQQQAIMAAPDMPLRSSWIYAFNDAFTLVTVAMTMMTVYFAWLAFCHKRRSQGRAAPAESK